MRSSLAVLFLITLFTVPATARAGEQGVGAAGAQVELAQGRIAWLESFLAEVRDLQAQGKASQTDVAQVEARLARARAELARRIGNLKEAEARYEAVIGEPPPN